MPRLAALVLMIGCLTTSPAAGQTVSTLTEPFNATADVAVGPDGNLYVADFGISIININGTTVYKVTPEGDVSVFATGLTGPSGNTVDAEGNLYQSNFAANTISRITPEGVVSTFADGEEDGVAGPGGLAIDSAGDVYVANCNNNSVAKAGSTVSFTSPLLICPNGLTIDDAGNLYATNFGNGSISKITPGGEVSLLAMIPGMQTGHITFANGKLYVVSREMHSVYEVTLSGEVFVLAGTGVRGRQDGPALQAEFSIPNGIVTVAIDSAGDVYVANCNNNSVAKAGSTVSFTSPLLICPNGLTIDDAGNLYATNFGNGSISKITPGGEVSLLAMIPGMQTGHITFANGKLYVVSREMHSVYEVTLSGEVFVLAGTGVRGRQDGPALQAEFSIPNGIAASATGDTLYVNDSVPVDGFDLHPNVIRMIVGVNSPATNVEEVSEEPPARFALRQNYPNPFKTVTRIRFAVSEPQEVTLAVYDVFGRLVATLVDAFKPAGTYEARFVAHGLASGIYFYRFQAGRFGETKTMLLVK